MVLLSGCVQVRLRTANENYDQFAYATAAKDYEYVLRNKIDNQAMINIADCYHQMGNAVKTEFWYRKIIKFQDAKPEWNLFLAEALMRNGKYSEAQIELGKYLELNKSDFRAQRMLHACSNLQQFEMDTTLYTINALRLNTPKQNYFSPAFYRSGIVFLSDKYYKGSNRTKSDWTGERYLDMFYAKKTDYGNWLDPEPIRGDVNGKFNEGPLVFSHDNNTMYFTRNNYMSNVIEKNKRNINVLKIYKSELVEGFWKIKGEMLFNSGEYSVGHPALSYDGTIMYFTSDMPWGYGGTDIYMVQYLGGNNWSQPTNLGAPINTEGNEMFPFLQNDSTLFFASDGLEGLGGLDIFESNKVNDVWSQPINLGRPINSSMDDFSYIIDSASASGYFSSNRESVEDKIFSFEKNLPKLQIQISVVDQVGNTPIDKVYITVQQLGKNDTVVVTNASGKVRFKADGDKDYSLKCDNQNYYLINTSTTTKGKRFSETVNVDVAMKKIKVNSPAIWEGVAFNKKDWQLKLSSSKALSSLVTLLSENPRLQIEIGSYTDSRGKDPENLSLTQRRAELVMQYLIAQGIKADRLTAKGYGETKLLNHCINGLLCIEEEHEINNRIEITVTSISKDTALK